MRLQKYLSQTGVLSRRKAEEAIAQGRVRVNGVVTPPTGQVVDPNKDRVELDGKTVSLPGEKKTILFHKPRGCVTTRRDEQGRKTVMDYLPLPLQNLFPVGRLDLQSEGMLLLTNDGDFANRVLHPRYEIQKSYWVMVENVPSPSAQESLVTRIPLEDGDGKFDLLKQISTQSFYEKGERVEGGLTSAFEVVVSEGRNRFIRRAFECYGHRVIRLKRVRIGGLELPSELPLGAFETLNEDQLQEIFK